MSASRSHIDPFTNQSNHEQTPQQPHEPSPEEESLDHGEETSHTEADGTNDELLVHILAARLTQVMQGEEEELQTIAFLQRENDNLRTQIILQHFGRGTDPVDHDLYKYWLRQQTRLERMKTLHERIRAHRAEIRRLLGVHMLADGDIESNCGDGR